MNRINISQIEIIKSIEDTYLDLKTQQMAKGRGRRRKEEKLAFLCSNPYKCYRNYSTTATNNTPKTTVIVTELSRTK